MNENIDLTKILKNCPKGTKLYSTIYGVVEFDGINEFVRSYPISFKVDADLFSTVTSDGRDNKEFDGECTLFPSKDQRDWSKFSAPWYKKERFDPKTLNPFDRVLVRDENYKKWTCNIFSYINQERSYHYKCTYKYMKYCIPYNEETKHLVGTTEEAPEYYRYWED